MDLLKEIHSSFDPFSPPFDRLPEEAYVDCQNVRGEWEVVQQLGLKITLSNNPTCQLFSGHRGTGKTTELRRLQKYLEQEKLKVVYVPAIDDIEPLDTDYAEILFACTRYLMQEIRLQNNPLLNWLKDHWESLRELGESEVTLDGLNLEFGIKELGKISTTVKAVPDKRRQFREKINLATPSLLEAINQFIQEAQQSLGTNYRGIVLIADNLDRIAETKEEGRPSNYNEIYLNRSEVLRGLNCHVIYTVPLPLIYSEHGTQLEDNYDKPNVLPMVMVCHPNGQVNNEGLEKLKELICRRIRLIDPRLVQTLDGLVEGVDVPAVFDSPETSKQLCLMSGGHVRNLMQLIQKSILWEGKLPITLKAVRRAISQARETYQTTILAHQWEILAQVYDRKEADNTEEHLRLLLNRCLLEYRYYDGTDTLQCWHDVHPLIVEIPRFQSALTDLTAMRERSEV